VTTTAATPTQVVADELDGPAYDRQVHAQEILTALAEHGYAVVSWLEPAEPAGCVGD
jgi:hypothetical protein